MMKDFFENKKYPVDIIIVIISSILCTVAVFTMPDGNILRIVLGIPLLIFIPGYVLVAALWPESHEELDYDMVSEFVVNAKNKSKKSGIDNLERIALSFGLSIAIVPLIGITLHHAWSISYESVLLSLFLFIIASSVIAWHRRNTLPEEHRFSIPRIMKLNYSFSEWSQKDKIVAVILSFSIISSTIALSFILLTPQEGEKFTEFYILDMNRTTENYPTNISVNTDASVIIGVVCHEYADLDYVIFRKIQNETEIYENNENDFEYGSPPSNDTINVFLNHGESFEVESTFSFEHPGRYRITWQLYVGEEYPEYELHLWVNVNS